MDWEAIKQQLIKSGMPAATANVIVATLMSTNLAATSGNTDTTQSAKSITKLTSASATALLKEAAKGIQYTGALTNAEIDKFIEAFDKEQKNQIEQVVKSVSTRIKPGAGADAIQKEITSVLQTQYPSYFNPKEFATNFLWSKVSFKDPSKLGGANIAVLQGVRQAVKDFNLRGVTEAEIENAAKSIAKGDKTLEDYKAELSILAQGEYPKLASRFASTPGLTTKQIAAPIINMLAAKWEVDPATIGFDEPIVAKWLHPVDATGKEVPYTFTDASRDADNNIKTESTTKANENARDAAVGLARAFGFGV